MRQVVRVYKVDHSTGFATCHIGYLPERYFAWQNINDFNVRYRWVDFDYRLSESSINRRKSYPSSGLLRGIMIENHPTIVGRNCLAGDPIEIRDDDPRYGKNYESTDITIMHNNRLEEYFKTHPMVKKNKKNHCNHARNVR
jgi:hypothetical protein